MFNNSNGGYSLSDIAAVTDGNRGGFGDWGGGSWWIVLLFFFAWGGFGGNGWGNNAGSTGAAVSADVTAALDANTIKTGLSDGFYAINTGMLNGFANTVEAVNAGTRTLQGELCDSRMADMQNTFTLSNQMNNLAAALTQNCNSLLAASDRNFAQLEYNLATEACADRAAISNGIRDVIDNANNNTRQIVDFLVQDRLSALSSENAALKNQISQAE